MTEQPIHTRPSEPLRTGPVTWVHASECPSLNAADLGVFDNLCACNPIGYAVVLPAQNDHYQQDD